jgi:phosphoglycerate dehydrogenase-like enzyme
MIKILANDGIDPIGKKMLEEAGFEVDTNTIPQDELPVKLQAYDGITVRSATKVRKALIDACPNLKMIGRGGVGVDNIDVEYAKEKGIPTYNTPASSSNSVAELVFGHLFTGARFLQDSNRKMPVEGGTKFNDLKKSYAKGAELRDALNSGQVSFAGLDVFDNEPTPRAEILSHPKISLTPHIGASTNEAQERIGVELATLIINHFKA